MKYKEVTQHYNTGQLQHHLFMNWNGTVHGEYREYHESGQLEWHYLKRSGVIFGEAKMFSSRGCLFHHYLVDGNGKEIATVISCGKSAIHTEEQLIQIGKEHNLPLLEDIPKTEEEVTLWNLKYPGIPCLPISTD